MMQNKLTIQWSVDKLDFKETLFIKIHCEKNAVEGDFII